MFKLRIATNKAVAFRIPFFSLDWVYDFLFIVVAVFFLGIVTVKFEASVMKVPLK